MKKIIIEFVEAKEQRYDCAGDYQELDDHILFKITNQETDDYSFVIAIHELIEKYLNMKDGVTDIMVDEFDMTYKGEYIDTGRDPKAPYHNQHMKAQIVERLLIMFLGHDWEVYDPSVKKK